MLTGFASKCNKEIIYNGFIYTDVLGRQVYGYHTVITNSIFLPIPYNFYHLISISTIYYNLMI